MITINLRLNYMTIKQFCFSLLFLTLTASLYAQVATFTIEVKNPLNVARSDQPITVSLSAYGRDIHRAVVCDGQQEIPSQLDDLNEDAYNDELFFLANLGPRQTKRYQVTFYSDGQQASYTPRTFAELVIPSKNKKLAKNKQDIYLRSLSFDTKTKDPYHYVHSHGLCFESELVAMRIYFDHRQTIDIYGKPHKRLVIPDTQFYPDSVQLSKGWGDDVLWVGNTYGLGALRGWDGQRQQLLDHVKRQEQRVIVEGPLRAIVEVENRGWVPAQGWNPITAIQRYTIYAGHRDFNVDVTFDRDVSQYHLATGLIRIKNSTEYSDGKGLRGCYGTDWPTGKDDGHHQLETVGLGIYVPSAYMVQEIPCNQEDYTMVIQPKGRRLSYKLAYTSANEDFGVGGMAGWYQWLKEWKWRLQNPVQVRIIKRHKQGL